jgi:hypothetical protein
LPEAAGLGGAGGAPGAPALEEPWPCQLPDELLPTLRDPQTFLLDRASGERVDVVELDHRDATVPRDRPPDEAVAESSAWRHGPVAVPAPMP